MSTIINSIIKAAYSLLFLLFVLSCASTPLPKNSSAIVPEDFFGIVHAGRTRSPEEYELLDAMGAKWILNTFYWNSIEGEKGSFNFSGYDAFVDTAISQGKKVLVVLGYEASWLFPEGNSKCYISPENLPHFLDFVEETVRHFQGRVAAWSVWNEPNISRFWKGPRKDFFELTRLAAQRIRETDPDAYIIGGVFVRSPDGFIKAMYKAGAMEGLDALAFHPYALNPRGAMQVYDNFSKVLSQINYTGPVWITEAGYPTGGWYPTKVSLEEQPAYVVKTIVGAAARGARALLWYELFDSQNEGQAGDSRDSERFFGLAYPDYSRKNGAWAYELCARYLPGSRYTAELPLRENIPSNIVSFCFMGGISGNNALILWNDRNRAQTINLQLPAPALLHDITNGRNSPLAAETALEVGNQPLIITWQGTATPRIFVGR
ncbi:MAG: cellulase family glycosylhydrolase [Treponema sp.]|jgi:hypothetical protein|nr:cellulase family glycosylhydrolase [Treponema sp.]